MAEEPGWKGLEKNLISLFESGEKTPQKEEIREVIGESPAEDIALAMDELTAEQAKVVFETLEEKVATVVLSKLNREHVKELLKKVPPQKLVEVVESLPPREAGSVLAKAPKDVLKEVEKEKEKDTVAIGDAENRRQYPVGTAGRLMTIEFLKVGPDTAISDAIDAVRKTDPKEDIPEDVYVVDQENANQNGRSRLLGVISIRDLLMNKPELRIAEAMQKDVKTVSAMDDEKDAAALLSKYKFMAIPVTDEEGYLVGVIPTDDLMPVVVNRLRKLYNRAVGTDAEKIQKLTPLQEARMRVPWLLGTMTIELGSGMVISHFDVVLKKVILLASFMPVISAISGNVGLQAAAITVRALDTGTWKGIWESLKREAAASFLMAMACGIVLGTIGAIWSKHIPFGIVIGIALNCSMLTAGLMGTTIPMVSKRLKFDPATTAGPFETAFQDIVGYSVFLGMATALQYWIS